MRIGIKLLAGYGIIAALVALSGYRLSRIHQEIRDDITQLGGSTILRVVDATEMTLALSTAQIAVHELLHVDETPAKESANAPDQLRRTLSHCRETIETHFQSFARSLERSRLAADARLALAEQSADRAAAEREAAVLAQLDAVAAAFAEHRRMMDQVVQAAAADASQGEALLRDRLGPHYRQQMAPQLAALKQDAEGDFTRSVRNVERAMQRAAAQQNAATLATLAAALAVGMLIARSIGRPLARLKQAAAQIGQRRFDVRTDIRSRDEIGVLAGAFHQMAADLEATTVSKDRLLASLHEKEVLLKEVHHRVKNNLQIISSLLNLQAQGCGDPQAARRFRESQSRIRSMALIHELLYRSHNLAEIDFGQYVGELTEHLARSLDAAGRRVRLTIDVRDATLPIDQAIPCGMIVNELVTNAIEHAFPQGRSGTITVQFTDDGGKRELRIADDGVGMPPAAEEGDSASLGLKVVHALVQQLGGTLETTRADGTAYRIRFPCGEAPAAKNGGAAAREFAADAENPADAHSAADDARQMRS